MKKMLDQWNSIHNRIFFSIILFLVIPFLMTFYFIDKPLEKTIEQKISDSAQQALYLVNYNVDSLLEDMLRSSVQISGNPSLTAMLKDPAQFSEFEKLRIKDDVFNKLLSFYFTDFYVIVIDLEGNGNSSRYVEDKIYKELTSADWYQEMIETPYQLKWMFNSKNYTYADNQPQIVLAKTVTDPQTKKNIGVLLFSVPEKDIRNYLANLDGEVYLLDRDGTVISSPNPAAVGTNISGKSFMSKIWNQPNGQVIVKENGEKWIANYDTLGRTGWKIVQLIPYDTVFRQIFNIRKVNILIVVLIFTVFVLITLTISYGISRPLKLLNKKMQEIEEKGFYSTLQATGPKEISTLIATYNSMVKEIRDLLHRLKEEFKQKEDLRFKVLQAQINPHFILNTINNIKWMAYIRNNHDVGEMLSSLGSIMEASLGKGESLISLKEEIAYTDHYIRLMKLKYNEKLSIHYEIPGDLLDCEVIKFMLQPVIENSIIHGIEPSKGKGEIWIKVDRRGDELNILVQDNGIGMEEDKLNEIRRWLSEKAERGKVERLGIKNVHDRIGLQYGPQYGLTLDSKPNQGTLVKFRLPVRYLGRKKHAESDVG